jgi:hypothetical protein
MFAAAKKKQCQAPPPRSIPLSFFFRNSMIERRMAEKCLARRIGAGMASRKTCGASANDEDDEDDEDAADAAAAEDAADEEELEVNEVMAPISSPPRMLAAPDAPA